MWDVIRDDFGLTSPAQMTDEHLWQWLSAAVRALKNSYARDGVAEDELMRKMCESTYLYFGYFFARLRTYSRDAEGVLAIQPNDTEDGYLCMHMRLFEDDVLVVGDGKTERAVRRALELWNSKAPPLPAKCQVMTTQDYTKLVQDEAT